MSLPFMIQEGDVLNENQKTLVLHLDFGSKDWGFFGRPCVLARFPGASVIPTPDRIMGAAKLVSMIVYV